MNNNESFASLPRLSTLAAAALALVLSACGGGGDDTATPEVPAGPKDIRIELIAKAGTQTATCGTTLTGLGMNGVNAEVHDLRVYFSEVALIDDKGNAVPLTLTANDWQNDKVALIDLENGTGACADKGTAATNNVIQGTVPAGNYKGIKLTVGVPGVQNHTDYAVAAKPLDIQALAWSWQAGRKFATIEVNPAGGVVRPAPAAPGATWYLHLGSTDCTGNPVTGQTVSCGRPNRMAVAFDAFDSTTQRIVFDLKTLLATSDLNLDLGSAPGCMSGLTDPECAAIFSALKLDLTTGQPIDGGRGQSLFRVEAK